MTTKLSKSLTLEISNSIDGAQARLESLLSAWRDQESLISGGEKDESGLCHLLFQIQIEQWHIIQDQLRLLKLRS